MFKLLSADMRRRVLTLKYAEIPNSCIELSAILSPLLVTDFYERGADYRKLFIKKQIMYGKMVKLSNK